MNELPKKIGLVAGNGGFPAEFLKEAKRKGYQVSVAAHKGETSAEVEKHCGSILWVRLGELNKIALFFKSESVDQIALLGGITRKNLPWSIRPDLLTLKVLFRSFSFRDMALFGTLTEEFEKKGIRLFDPRLVLKDAYQKTGVLTNRGLTAEEQEDAKIGWQRAKQIGEKDIGQTVVVSSGKVIGVEGDAGTDAVIRSVKGKRDLSSCVVVKVVKPKQDTRIDLPAVGINTIESMIYSGCTALVLEENGVLFLDKEKVVKKADQNNLAIVVM